MVSHDETRELLLSHQARLRAAASMTDCQFARTRAFRLLWRVGRYLSVRGDLSDIAGFVGENGIGPRVEDIIADCESRPMPALVDERAALKRRAA